MSRADVSWSRRRFLLAAGAASLLGGSAAGCRRLSGALPAATAGGGGGGGDTGAMAPAARRVFLHTSRPRQTIDGFGASGCWSLDPIGAAWSDENKERLAELLFSRDRGIGLSLWRFNLGGGDPNPSGYANPWRRPECLQPAAGAPIDGKRQAGQQWFLHAAKRHGVEKTLAFTNSPPVWLTKNGRAFGDPAGDGTNLKPGGEGAFADFLVTALRYFEAQGLPFDYLSPVNEPNWRWTGGQEGCTFYVDTMTRVGQAVVDRVRAAGLRTQVCLCEAGDLRALLDDDAYRDYRRVSRRDIVFSSPQDRGLSGVYRGYAGAILDVPSLRESVARRVTGHSYWTDSAPHDLQELRAALRQNLDRYAPGASFWMTEYCVMENGRDLGMDTALRVATVIHHDLTAAEASSWQWWLAVSNGDYKDGLIYTDWGPGGGGGPQNVLPSKTLWALGQWSRFVRPGARRIELDTDALPDEALVSAYVWDQPGPDSRLGVAVVVVNPTAAPVILRLAADRPVASWAATITDASRDLQSSGTFSSSDVEIPSRSVVTLQTSVSRSRAATESANPPIDAPARRERSGAGAPALYDVRCGASEDRRIDGARRNSRADMPYGADPGTGFLWGYASYGEAAATDAHDGGDGSARRDTGRAPGQGITYRFEAPSNRPLRIRVRFAETRRQQAFPVDVEIQGELADPALSVGSAEVVREYRVNTVPGGDLTVRVLRPAGSSAPDADPYVSRIEVLDT